MTPVSFLAPFLLFVQVSSQALSKTAAENNCRSFAAYVSETIISGYYLTENQAADYVAAFTGRTPSVAVYSNPFSGSGVCSLGCERVTKYTSIFGLEESFLASSYFHFKI
jgi:hypothetical protein